MGSVLGFLWYDSVLTVLGVLGWAVSVSGFTF
jgi:hypothetical protein